MRNQFLVRFSLCLCVFVVPLVVSGQNALLRFEITTNRPPSSGRLFVVISKSARPEPRNRIGETGMDASPFLARDVRNFGAGVVATIDRTNAIFPIENLDDLPVGDY